MLIGIGVVAVLCLVGVISAGGLLAASQNDSADSTSNAQLQQTLADRVRMTSTSQAIGTSTARVKATQQGILNQLESDKNLVYGPTSGELVHAEGESIIAQEAGVNLRDFSLEAQFQNPYPASEGAWDYGFLVRHETKNVHFRFVVQSDKKWVLINNNGDPNGETVAQGQIPALKTGANETNRVKLIFQGNRGWFFLNDNLISELDLSARMNSGEIYIATGIFQKSKNPGAVTKYSDYSIWALP